MVIEWIGCIPILIFVAYMSRVRFNVGNTGDAVANQTLAVEFLAREVRSTRMQLRQLETQIADLSAQHEGTQFKLDALVEKLKSLGGSELEDSTENRMTLATLMATQRQIAGALKATSGPKVIGLRDAIRS